MDKHVILKKYFGHTEFRNGQLELIDSILSGRDVLGIMPTGAGKSVCYQIPALMQDGITLVISPLISLMKDQVSALVQSGVNAAYINSSLSATQNAEVFRRASSGNYKIIYVAPERLGATEFLSFAEQTKISMVTVDEAHCVSQWGQDFRPSYLKIVEFIEKLSYRPVVSAFTATATKEVRDDICHILRFNDPLVITTGFDRKNLYFEVQKPKSKPSALLEIIKRNSDKCGIVYCSTRKAVEEVCENLNENGIPSTRYHAGLNDVERFQNQDDFIYDRKQVMVATNAFGMGIDKSNVSFVVHYNMPKNIESYYQEAGRAGRDGEPAQCILLYSGQDVRTNQFLIDNASDNSGLVDEIRQAVKKKDRERLKAMTFYCTTSECLREYILRYFGETSSNYCGNCSNCNTNFDTVDVTVEAQKIVSCVYRVGQRHRNFGKAMITDILHGSKNEKIIKSQLDTLSTHGIMADISVHRIRDILNFLVESGYLTLTDDEYPVLALTTRSNEIIREQKPVSMKLSKDIKLETSQNSQKKSAVYDVDNVLFKALKDLRNQLAYEAHVPSYIIFADAALSDMCRKLPCNSEEFLEVSGVGALKLEKHGARFTELIINYLSEHPDLKKTVPNIPKEKNIIREQVASTGKLSANSPWTPEEDSILEVEFDNNFSIRVLSEKHQRTPGAIISRLKKLGLE